MVHGRARDISEHGRSASNDTVVGVRTKAINNLAESKCFSLFQFVLRQRENAAAPIPRSPADSRIYLSAARALMTFSVISIRVLR